VITIDVRVPVTGVAIVASCERQLKELRTGSHVVVILSGLLILSYMTAFSSCSHVLRADPEPVFAVTFRRISLCYHKLPSCDSGVGVAVAVTRGA
jgi:hypothetical protein